MNNMIVLNFYLLVIILINTTNNTTTNTTIITTSNIDYIYEGWKRNVVGNRIFKQEKRRMKAWMTNNTLLLIEEKRRIAVVRNDCMENKVKYKEMRASENAI